MTATERKLVEETAVEGEEPETAAEYLLDVYEEMGPRLPALRRALEASKAIP